MPKEPHGLQLIQQKPHGLTSRKVKHHTPVLHKPELKLTLLRPDTLVLILQSEQVEAGPLHYRDVTLCHVHIPQLELTLHTSQAITHLHEIHPLSRFELKTWSLSLPFLPGRVIRRELRRQPCSTLTLLRLLSDRYPWLNEQTVEHSIARWNASGSSPECLRTRSLRWTLLPWLQMRLSPPQKRPTLDVHEYSAHAVLFWEEHFQRVNKKQFLQDLEATEQDPHTLRKVRQLLPRWEGIDVTGWLQTTPPSAFLASKAYAMLFHGMWVWTYPHKLPDGVLYTIEWNRRTHLVAVKAGAFVKDEKPLASQADPLGKGMLEVLETINRVGRKPGGVERQVPTYTLTLEELGWVLFHDLKTLADTL